MSGIRVIIICLVATVLVPGIVSASSETLEGEWQSSTNAADRLRFFGNQSGCRSENAEDSYFQYVPAGTNSLSLTFGGGIGTVVTYVRSGDTLTTTDSSEAVASYTLVGTCTNECQKGIAQLIGAKAICKQDDPDAWTIPVGHMMRYLESMPVCPGGGTYFLQPGQEPRCSSTCCKP